MATRSGPNWRTKGTLLQGCNCDYGCPCNFNAPPTDGSCDAAWIGYIDEGNYGDARLDGLNFSIGAHWPEAIHLGNGEGFVLIDERADQAQRDGLVAILTGKVGGPFGILANTITNLHAPQFLPFDIKLDGANSTVRVGSALELEMEPIKNPVSGAEAYPGVVLPQGILYKESTRASTKTFRVRAGVNFESSGKDAAWSPFEWSGP
ncbi:MAG: DUF1326 domain-containing protein [Chloroflexi bacterium]|nr:DUF1326 domain-containing protein [Chloroflexota bacterium]